MNCPLYIAPTPGISPRMAASTGLGVPAGGGTNGRCPLCHAIQHGSQKICPPDTLRMHVWQIGLPQFWQYEVAVIPLWFTQSILCPFSVLVLWSCRTALSCLANEMQFLQSHSLRRTPAVSPYCPDCPAPVEGPGVLLCCRFCCQFLDSVSSGPAWQAVSASHPHCFCLRSGCAVGALSIPTHTQTADGRSTSQL